MIRAANDVKSLVLTLSFLLSFSAQPSFSAEVFLNVGPPDLYKWCRAYVKAVRNNIQAADEELMSVGMCLGYVFASLDIEAFVGVSDKMPDPHIYRACIPDGFTPAQRAEVVAVYLDNHPELQAKVPYLAVLEAMAKSFPCL